MTEPVHKGYRVHLRRELYGACNAFTIDTMRQRLEDVRPAGSIVSWLELDVFVEDNPDSDRELVNYVLTHYPGFVLHTAERLAC